MSHMVHKNQKGTEIEVASTKEINQPIMAILLIIISPFGCGYYVDPLFSLAAGRHMQNKRLEDSARPDNPDTFSHKEIPLDSSNPPRLCCNILASTHPA